MSDKEIEMQDGVDLGVARVTDNSQAMLLDDKTPDPTSAHDLLTSTAVGINAMKRDESNS